MSADFSEYCVPKGAGRGGVMLYFFGKPLKSAFQNFPSWVPTPRYVKMLAPATLRPGSEIVCSMAEHVAHIAHAFRLQAEFRKNVLP